MVLKRDAVHGVVVLKNIVDRQRRTVLRHVKSLALPLGNECLGHIPYQIEDGEYPRGE